MILYNLFPTLAGSFSHWRPHLERAAQMGFDWIFVNPIQLPGRSGSLYSIANYFRIRPALIDPGPASPEEQVRQVIQQAHEMGLKVMIDLVINHCAYDAPVTSEHPEWFVRNRYGGIAHASCEHERQKVVWTDLAQFNHHHTPDPEGLCQYCLAIVTHLLSLGFDGFRCDAAFQLPRRTWARLIQGVHSRHPHAVFAAETLGCSPEQACETARAGFQYVFNSSKYWNFHDWWLIEQYNLLRETTSSISFPESHDTPRLALEVNGNTDAIKQRYLFSALFSAGVMMPIGFEFAFRKPLHVVKTSPADWEETGVDLTGYIRQVNAIKRSQPVFQEESLTQILNCPNPNVLLMWKASVKQRQEALLILNKDLSRHQDFWTDHFRHYIQSGLPLRDVSPEYPLDYLHEPFHYGLRPGQGIVLVTETKR